MESVLSKGTFYYHPLTRKPMPKRKLILWPDGEATELIQDFKIEFRDSLTLEEIVRYYYDSVKLEPIHQRMPRDIGGVKYTVVIAGLDIALFAIDALATDYLETEHRAAYPPDIIQAANFVQEGSNRLGQTKLVAAQYGVDEHAFAG